MSTNYVAEFLGSINCSQYVDAFLNYKFTSVTDLKHIDKEMLIAMGVIKIGDRIRILRSIRTLNNRKRDDLATKLKEVIAKYNSLTISGVSINEDLVTDKHSVIFILNDGSAKKVGVNGCFSADSIKNRLLKRLPKELLGFNSEGKETYAVEDYDVFVVDYKKNSLHLLYDVELVTICHSKDRIEKNRLIFVSKNETPNEKAILTSKKLYLKTLSVLNRKGNAREYMGSHISNSSFTTTPMDGSILHIDNEKSNMRKVFDQRPPSEYISTNLAGYFPQADMKRLEHTLKTSFRQSVRLSNIRSRVLHPDSNKVGDILLKHSNAVDAALLQSLEKKQSSQRLMNNVEGPKLHKGDTRSRNSNMIQLLKTVNSDEDESEDIVSLPTQIVTPKAWLKGACIGSGSFGSVYLGMNAKTGELMAVKQVELPQHIVTPTVSDTALKENGPSLEHANLQGQKKTSNDDIHRKMVDALQHEMNLLKELHHENIVTYYGSSQEGGNLNIFLEYVPGGSVSSMLNTYGPFEESLIINFTRQILIGVAYLHNKNIIHRDIKGANILIDIKGCVKITDFGISKKLSPLNKKQDKRASLQGSVYWMAPEVVKQAATTEKADIWSAGCVVIEMFTGKHPFPDFSQMQAIFKIGTNTSPDLPSWATEKALDFLQKAFELDYKKRPGAVELLQHPWVDAHII